MPNDLGGRKITDTVINLPPANQDSSAGHAHQQLGSMGTFKPHNLRR
jgi:hypothetical protein